ncbi:MAG TPA: glutamate--cysteine ligase, partial [Polyangiaceae bacterium]|nr:glutamate--cysteine ligase [Polyangiaceae bacterium]
MPDRDTRDTRLCTPNRLTLGVEEEFHLVDLASRGSSPRARDVLARLEATTPRACGAFAAELQQSVVETNSAVTGSLAELRGHLVALREELCATAESLGVGVAAAGTMPLSAPLVMTETPRFRRMLAEYQALVREQLICGLQVHVGIGSRDVAVQLLDRVSPWLPPLLALSASSPFSHAGEDTGYASTRTLIWSRWPTTGRAGTFASAGEYDAMVQQLVASGVISDAGMLYFDVRPSAHAPTLELRICDACTSVDSVVLIAGLFRAIVARELERLRAGQPSTARVTAVERAALWRAARSGLEGELVDLSGPKAVPAAVLVRGLIDELRPELEAQGDLEVVRGLAEAALGRGSSAARQRDVLRQRERVTDVVDWILAETRGDSVEPRLTRQASALYGAYSAPGHDEGIAPDGRPRSAHARVLAGLEALGVAALRERAARIEREQL